MKPKSWEKELKGWKCPHCGGLEQEEINATISQELEKFAKEIRLEKKEPFYPNCECNCHRKNGHILTKTFVGSPCNMDYNQAISDLNEQIKKALEKRK